MVKLTDGRLVDPFYDRRVRLTEQLAALDPCVVGPVRVTADLVLRVGEWRVVAYPFIEGTTPDLATEGDVARMATVLASLHQALATIESCELPLVAALVDSERPDGGLFGTDQLLHGDFSSANVRFEADCVKVFDYDDCGYGPIEFEIGNCLYMVLFDATMAGDHARYVRFRRWFVDAYESGAGISLDPVALDAAIGLRKAALGRWIDDPQSAPIGIRSASSEWRARLRDFVDSVNERVRWPADFGRAQVRCPRRRRGARR